MNKELKSFLSVGLAFVLIILFTIYMYNNFFKPEPSQITYNNYVFNRKQDLWVTEVQVGNQLITIPLHYSPWETENIPLNGSLHPSFNYGDLYVTFDPDNSNTSIMALAAGELSLNLAQGIQRNLISACSKNITEPCASKPIINCENTDLNVIYLKESSNPGVTLQDRCITIQGQGTDLIKSVDQLLFFWYGVIGN
ncbi:MAG: hypothetical protein MAG795_00608 [Candidatus Woesearchaeota archaeon]|nr:hypothetical protein [Candidatus Woesearchaeota archaeon]